MKNKNQTVGIIDFGGQYAHLIASQVRNLGTFSEILSNEESIKTFSSYAGLVLSGGPESVYDEKIPNITKEIFDLNIPILGICYGFQLFIHILGGKVQRAKQQEYGRVEIEIEKSPLFQGLEKRQIVWMSHTDEVVQLPEGFKNIAKSKNCTQVGVQNLNKHFYGIQFHAEVTHTQNGKKVLENFISICKVSHTWSLTDFFTAKKEELEKKIQNKKVFLFLSGGVDSTVCYLFLSKMISSNKIKGVLIDTGFMRKYEIIDLTKQFKALNIDDFIVYDAKEKFYEKLKNQREPEIKREIVGNLFIELQNQIMEELDLKPSDWLLAQGTIYPDTIESGGTKNSHRIKIHHNRVEKMRKMIDEGKVIEPLKDLYKDKVRELGKMFGLEDSWLHRHPFPGPGLIIRLITKETQFPIQYKDLLKCHIKEKNIKDLKLQILPIASVGIQGDKRTYKNCILLNSSFQEWDFYQKTTNDFINYFSFLNRVLFEPFYPKKKELLFNSIELNQFFSDLLREIDFIVYKILIKYNLLEKIWQFPVILLPLGERKDKYSVVLRPITSQESMTADFYRMDWNILNEMVDSIKSNSYISNVFYDITTKPPATIEWE